MTLHSRARISNSKVLFIIMIKNPTNNSSSDTEIIDLFALKNLSSEELEKVATKHKIEAPNNYLKQDLIFEILQSQIDSGGIIHCSGVLEILPDNFGFLKNLHFQCCGLLQKIFWVYAVHWCLHHLREFYHSVESLRYMPELNGL